MFAYLLKSKILPNEHYDWFTYQSAKPVSIDYRGTPVKVSKGTKFGVRPSTNGKFIRLVFPDQITKVFTIDLDTAKSLAKGVGRE